MNLWRGRALLFIPLLFLSLAKQAKASELPMFNGVYSFDGIFTPEKSWLERILPYLTEENWQMVSQLEKEGWHCRIRAKQALCKKFMSLQLPEPLARRIESMVGQIVVEFSPATSHPYPVHEAESYSEFRYDQRVRFQSQEFLGFRLWRSPFLQKINLTSPEAYWTFVVLPEGLELSQVFESRVSQNEKAYFLITFLLQKSAELPMRHSWTPQLAGPLQTVKL